MSFLHFKPPVSISLTQGKSMESKKYCARIGWYKDLDLPPITEDFSHPDLLKFIDNLASKVEHLQGEQGGVIPSIAIKAVIENLIHADFQDVIISILFNGQGIIVSDQGPGIVDKKQALKPGFTTANSYMRNYIRGVGSGLYTARQMLEQIGGKLLLADNLNKGTCISLLAPLPVASASDYQDMISLASEGASSNHGESIRGTYSESDLPILTKRQQDILTLILDQGPLGPSRVAELIRTSPSSAYRDLVVLTDLGLVSMTEGGKRQATSDASRLNCK